MAPLLLQNGCPLNSTTFATLLTDYFMIQVGRYNTLKVSRKAVFGFYLDDGAEGILLPKRFAPNALRIGDELTVFVYHDSDNRLIATTQKPFAVVGDIVQLTAVSVTPQGAFLDWGLMKDLFVARSQQPVTMVTGGKYLVRIYIDEQTGRTAATARIDAGLSNNELNVQEMEPVDLLVYRRTDIGFVVIINNRHTGMLYFNEVFGDINPGQQLKGFIKKIRTDNKIDVGLGKPGYSKVEDEAGKILRLLQENDGYLPYHDKSEPEEIYAFFGMSKKVFKMTIGALYKQHKIQFAKTGIQLLES